MYLTQEILEREDACPWGFDWFKVNYPNGVELIDIVNNPKTPFEFLHWGRVHLSNLSQEEIAAYDHACQITDSLYVSDSENVARSQNILESNNIEDSAYIYLSKNITSSEAIVKGENVKNSTFVYDSSVVLDSKIIAKSGNIKNSINILDCNSIINSTNALNSSLLTNTHYATNSKNITNGYFLGWCQNLRNALFCYDVHDGEYLLFNKPIEKEQWEWTRDTFVNFMKEPLKLIKLWNKEEYNYIQTVYDRPFLQLETEPTQLFKWVKTLPGYDKELMFELTLNETFL